MRLLPFLMSLFVLGTILSACQKDDDGMLDDKNTALYSGGENYTTFDFGENAFGGQGDALTRDESRLFVAGNSLFRTNWVAAPASVVSLDGLGPVFNAISCGSCHFKDGRAAPMDEFSIGRPGLLWRVSLDGVAPDGAPLPHPVYGGQIQDGALPGVDPEAVIETTYELIDGNYADGTSYTLQKPSYTISESNYGTLEESIILSPRIATHLAGLGLLESIPEEAILANVDEADSDQDGISGKANYAWNVQSNRHTLGRFGWKANQPNVRQQNAGAFNGDMGLTSSLFPEDEFTSAQEMLFPDIIDGGQPEISDEQLDRITLYVKTLAVPAKRDMETASYMEGELLFQELKCASCHIPSFQTGLGSEIPSLDNQTIYPYTDLLLHDMGEGLSDQRSDYDAEGSEWRTPPLWGIGLIRVVNGHTRFLHDGRARNIEEAILWHGGEADASKEAFKKLSKTDREQLIFFLESI